MSQRKNKIYNFINNPLIYKIIQGVMSGTSFRNNIIKKFSDDEKWLMMSESRPESMRWIVMEPKN